MVRKTEHLQGEIYFNYSRVDFEDEDNSSGKRSIVFTLTGGTLRKKSFSPTKDTWLNSIDLLNKNKIRVFYNSEKDQKDLFTEERNQHIEHGVRKTNKNLFFLILKANEVSTSGDEITLNRSALKCISWL